MSTDERNALAKKYVDEKLDLAAKMEECHFSNIPQYKELNEILNALIIVQTKGFRGIVVTALTGKYLDTSYDPLNNFYDCNPRSIFEQAIFYSLRSRIPCGKSDPLNVAKNINVLNDEWAQGKRPHSAAKAVVDFLRLLEEAPSEDKIAIENFFFFRLLEYGNSVISMAIEAPEETCLANQSFANLCIRFVLEFPESGATPQFVISRLLHKVYTESSHIVEGGDESVFGTNTTSKKPADIWLSKNGSPSNLFEITVKKIDTKRLDDCIETLNELSILDRPVQFVCRIPEDIQGLQYSNDNTIILHGKTINFIDIRAFIQSLISLLDKSEIEKVISELSAYVGSIERPVKTKNGWNSIFNPAGTHRA